MEIVKSHQGVFCNQYEFTWLHTGPKRRDVNKNESSNNSNHNILLNEWKKKNHY